MDPDIKKMAYAEYAYFSGEHEKAVELSELYLSCENQMMQLSACLIYSFANLILHHINSARLGLKSMAQKLEQLAQKNTENRALIVFMAGASRVLLHLPIDDLPELTKRHFMKAWELAEPDDLIEGIEEHQGLLQGLIETCMKEEYPQAYERIIGITYRFSYGWRRRHNPDTHEKVADNLTTTEFTIAMLANRGWTNAEIAEYMGITERTVKQRLTDIFNKLNISNRKQLKDYMLR